MHTIKYWISSFLLIFITSPIGWSQYNKTLESFEKEFVKIIEKVRTSVVSVEIYYKDQAKRISSGIILDKAGHIITVAKPLDDFVKILVQVESGKKYGAVLLGTDLHTNLAVLKISAPNLKPVERGYSDRLRLGAFLIVVGNPYGLKKSVSVGIVSGLNRTVLLEGCKSWQTGIIQTTAPINPGDAGGLVVDSKGRFVGMASSTLARTCGFAASQIGFIAEKLKKLLHLIYQGPKTPHNNQLTEHIKYLLKIIPKFNTQANLIPSPQGINFVLPSNTIYWVATQIIRYGKVPRGWLGVKVVDSGYGEGVLVIAVVKGSPAEKSGILPGDLLLKVDNTRLNSSDKLLHYILHSLVNQKVTFLIKRNNQKFTITCTLCSPPHKHNK